jgi:hypothetical protein
VVPRARALLNDDDPCTSSGNQEAMAVDRAPSPRRRAAIDHTRAATPRRHDAATADQQQAPSRRGALLAAAAAAVAAATAVPQPLPALARGGGVRTAADAKAVGSYLPPAPASLGVPEGFVLYAPGARATPSLKAGVIQGPQIYSWALEPSMRQEPLRNALTGDFCFPNCVEPWYEAVFVDGAVGKVFLCCLVLQKVLPSARQDGGGATVEALGSPEGVARALGPLVTGQGYEDEDLARASVRRTADGRVFYDLELLASTADPSGPRRLAAVTVKGGVVYLFVAAATERQWSSDKGAGEQALRAMVQSFQA